MDEDPLFYSRMVNEWMAGDLAGLSADALTVLHEASPRLYARLISERNARWARAVEQRLRRGGLAVVVVGVGHLVASGGVPALLRADGVAVEGP